VATVALGVVGAAVGGAVGGLPGARLGFSVGTLVGSVVEVAKQKPQSVGRLTDLHLTGSQYGSTIPWIWGRRRVGGSVIWWSDLTETSRKRGSKSVGGRTKVYTYSVDVAVMVCRGPITAIRKIWANDTVIYDLDAGLQPAWITTYLGTVSQNPDATMSAALPAGQTPAYRGRAYVVFDNMPLAEYGNQLPNFSFLVENSPLVTLAADSFNRTDGPVGNADTGQTWLFGSTQAVIASNRAETTGIPGRMNWIECSQADVTVQLTCAVKDPVSGVGYVCARITDEDNGLMFGNQELFSTSTYELIRRQAGADTIIGTCATGSLAGDVIKIVTSGSTISCYVNGTLRIQVTETFNQTATKHGFAASANNPIDNWSATTQIVGATDLKTILTDVFTEVGLTAGTDFDVTAAIDIVKGFMIADRTEARAAVSPPCLWYTTDLVEGNGKILAVKRGGVTVMTIDADDMGAEITEGNDLEPKPVLSTRRIQELELPFRVDVTYASINKEYQQGEQHDVRFSKPYLTEQITFETGLSLTEDEARQGASRLLHTAYLERERFECSLLPKYLPLLPADPVTVPVPGNTAGPGPAHPHPRRALGADAGDRRRGGDPEPARDRRGRGDNPGSVERERCPRCRRRLGRAVSRRERQLRRLLERGRGLHEPRLRGDLSGAGDGRGPGDPGDRLHRPGGGDHDRPLGRDEHG
jgi:hypothetical protein